MYSKQAFVDALLGAGEVGTVEFRTKIGELKIAVEKARNQLAAVQYGDAKEIGMEEHLYRALQNLKALSFVLETAVNTSEDFGKEIKTILDAQCEKDQTTHDYRLNIAKRAAAKQKRHERYEATKEKQQNQ